MSDREKVAEYLETCMRNRVISESFSEVIISLTKAEEIFDLLKEQEVKKGYWINPTSQDCHCSECGEQPVHEPGESVPLYNFCPYCGAKMEVKWNE